MKKLTLILILLSMMSYVGYHRVDVWKTITIAPGHSMAIDKLKAPVTLEIKNQSDEKLTIVSQLRIQKEILAHSDFNYRLPKKSRLILVNSNSHSVSIHLHYTSSRPIIINNKELR